jgi:hypothetical protein
LSLQVVGSGSFGVVFSATIAETGEAVAVKKVARAFCTHISHLQRITIFSGSAG